MSSIDRNPSFKTLVRHEGARAGLKTVKNAGNLLVQDKVVPDASDFVRFKKTVAVIKDRNGKKRYA
jgi:hypothetical protein